MASRPGFPRAKASTSPNAASVGATHVNNILKNYSHEQVINALMTQLREKETQLAALSEQRQVILRQQQITEESNKQLKSRIDAHNKTAAEKDTKIASLEKKLAREKKASGSVIAEAKLKHLTEKNAESQRIIQERDDELSRLRPILKELKAKVDEYERNANVQLVAKLEEELVTIKGELATAKEENLASSTTIEELEKKSKGKEWIIKSLKEESNDQRSKENHLLTHIKTLKEKIETYETKFKGKGTDVPILLAKLKDYEVRVKELQRQVRRLTNKKLNELVLRSSAPTYQAKITKEPSESVTASLTTSRSPLQEEEDDESKASENSFSIVTSDHYEEEEATLATNGTDEMDEQFYAKSIEDEDVLGDFLSDVKVGIETLQTEGLCCSQGPTPDMSSPLSGLSPSSYSSSQEQRSPTSYNSSRTFTSGSRSDV